ncbi:potassium voltage-gated channel subfamily G member 1 [Garra rufa]|uniref:potassium voltage-gated channel subfamily G member 1 n=1 Tax=Garra rufa TaxID=137080 RepID=UPI003CCEE9CE
MTLLAGDGSDYDYSALSCTSDTSLNAPPIHEQEALKGVYYKRAQRLPPTDPNFTDALHTDDNGNLPSCGQRLHVIINVGGLRYQLPWTTLEDFPLSRLGQLRLCSSFDEIMRVCDDYDVVHNEFFFDRSPCAFRTILTFLRAGKLRSLREMCALSFQEELLYWGVPEESLEWCCRRRLIQRVEECDELERVAEEDEDDEDDSESGLARESRLSRWMGKLRDMVEKPHSGLPGKIFACLSVLFVTITAINLSISTMPAMREEEETVSINSSNKLLLFKKRGRVTREFSSIPATYWWAVITMTTVGYGDMVPRSIPGQVVALSSILSGILLMAFPVTSIFHTFSRSYVELKQEQQRLLQRRTHFLLRSRIAGLGSNLSVESDVLFPSVSSDHRNPEE